MSDKTITYVKLVHGQSNTTPWGKRDVNGRSFQCANATHLRYYKGNGRYELTEVAATSLGRVKKLSVAKLLGRPAQGGAGKGKGVITVERLTALCKMAVSTKMGKSKLKGIARDLGINDPKLVRGGPSAHSLVRAIKARQAEVTAELEETEEEPKADDPKSDDDGSKADDKE